MLKINCSDTWQSPRIIPSALAASCTSATSPLLCPMTKPVDKSWRSMVSEDEEAATEMERPSLRSTEPKADLSWDLYNTLPVLSKIVSQLFIHLRVGECKNRGSEWALRLGPSIGSNVRSGLRSSVHFWTENRGSILITPGHSHRGNYEQLKYMDNVHWISSDRAISRKNEVLNN